MIPLPKSYQFIINTLVCDCGREHIHARLYVVQTNGARRPCGKSEVPDRTRSVVVLNSREGTPFCKECFTLWEVVRPAKPSPKLSLEDLGL